MLLELNLKEAASFKVGPLRFSERIAPSLAAWCFEVHDCMCTEEARSLSAAEQCALAAEF